MNISLTQELEALVQETVRSGRYSSASEVVREALRLFQEREQVRQIKLEQLRKDIAVGIEQIERGEATPLDMEEIKAEARARWKARH
jgi:antitoxin ParD1/3/4